MTSSFSGSYREIIDNMGLALAIYRAVDDGDDFVFVATERAGAVNEGAAGSDAL